MPYKIELNEEEMAILKDVLDRHFNRYHLTGREERLFQKIKQTKEE